MIKHLEPWHEGQSEKRLNFETLLAEISSRFVHIPAHQVDCEIEEALRLICKSLAVDQSTIYLRDIEDPDAFVLSYVLRDPALSPPPKTRFTAAENFPWCNKKLIANEIIYLPDIEDAPHEAEVDKAMWRKFGIYSALVIPLSTGGQRPAGFWGIDSTSKRRDWPEPLRKRLKIIADVFANALERTETERQLRESEARLRLAADIAGAGFWTLDLKTGVIWTTDKLKDMFGVKPDDTFHVARLLDIVHPDDRELVRQGIDLMATGREEAVEYRIVPSAGPVRWVMSRGSRRKYTSEELSILTGITLDITERRMAEEELRNLSGRLLEAQEQERKRIARELHDGINQQVALIVLGIQQLRSQDHLAPAKRHQIMDQLGKDAQRVANEIQALSHELHSSSLEYLGLSTAIEGACFELRKLHGADIRFTHRNVPKSLHPDLSLALFRITQESLHNAIKYSGVNRFEIRLQATQNQIELTIRDFGVGFDVDKATQSHGLGLISMRERVIALNGLFTIRSQSGSGTEIKACVPLRMTESVTKPATRERVQALVQNSL